MLALELQICYSEEIFQSWNIKNMVTGYEDEGVK